MIAAVAAAVACSGSAGDPVVDEITQASPTVIGANVSSNVIERGGQLYAQNCQMCHGGANGEGRRDPAPLHNADGHTWHHPDAQLADFVTRGKPPGLMPAFGDRLTREEIEAVLAFIKTWWTEEQRADQADISVRYQEAIERQRSGE